MGFFEKIKQGLEKTKESMLGKIKHILNSFTKIDEDLFEQLEETMIMSDIGVETSVKICEELRKKIKEQGITDPACIMELIQDIVADMMGDDTELNLATKPSVILVIGVNGVGKTTTIGKLCHRLKNEGKKVIVAAADTFRAAAIEQLEIWSERAGAEIVKHSEGSDPASVVFDALTAAKARGCDVVICDTAGRLHNKKNLMDELAKINRVIDKQTEGCAKEVLLVLDATTGQNAVNQAKVFKEAAGITGIVLTKLDGTAKGGIVISIKNELGIPVKLIGLGEKLDDLQPFNSRDFVRALFDEAPADEKVKESDYKRLDGDEDAEYSEISEETETEKSVENISVEEKTVTEDNSVEESVSVKTDNNDDKSETEPKTEEKSENNEEKSSEFSSETIAYKTDDEYEIPGLRVIEQIANSEEWETTEISDEIDYDEYRHPYDNIEETEEQEEPKEEKKKFSFKNLFKRKKDKQE